MSADDIHGDVSVERGDEVAVIGAGPKGLALAAKARILEQLGWDVPRVILFDEHGVAANWTGQHGYTDGRQSLGTPPEKDLGYPYRSQCWDDDNKTVDQAMLKLSWSSYLIDIGKYSDWIDRGRPQPNHAQWSEYLQWAATRIKPEIRIGRVSAVSINNDQWSIETRTTREEGDVTTTFPCDALVLTGPGSPRTLLRSAVDEVRVFDGESVWRHYDRLAKLPGRVNVCVVGSGETAASVAVAMLEHLPKSSTIEIVCRHGVVYSRGESYQENRLYSKPHLWTDLSEPHRKEFVKRTDRGVFSLKAKSVLDASERVEYVAGSVSSVHAEEGRVVVELDYESHPDARVYDYLVDATGFDAMAHLRFFTDVASEHVRNRLGLGEEAHLEPTTLEARIGPGLDVEGMSPKLHLPMLAAFAQGPGFPNLSCLGLLSDRVLSVYAKKDTDSKQAMEETIG